jgi:hypothetical protein
LQHIQCSAHLAELAAVDVHLQADLALAIDGSLRSRQLAHHPAVLI